jgi:hypothetical protein
MSTRPDLSSARLKVERAHKHILDIEQWIATFNTMNAHPVMVGVHPETGENKGSHVRVFKGPMKMPEGNVSCIVGDAVNNLRAALEHVAAAIYIARAADPKESTFPIDRDTESLIKQPRYRKIETVAPDLAPIIADYVGADGSGDLFVAMNQMAVADKHRVLITTIGLTKFTVHCIEDEDEPREFAPGFLYVLPGGKRPSPTSVAYAHNERNSQPAMEIIFGEGEIFQDKPVIATLHQFVQLVAGLIDVIETT